MSTPANTTRHGNDGRARAWAGLLGVGLGFGLGVGMLIGTGPANPEPPQDASATAPERGTPASDPERARVRERLAFRLEMSKKQATRLEEALKLLDGGADLDDVHDLVMPAREGMFSFLRRGERGERGDGPGRPERMDRPPPPRRGGPGAERGPEHDRDRPPPPPPPPHGGPGPEGRGGPGGEDEGRRLMDWLREHNPELERRVDQARREDPELFRRVMQRFKSRVATMVGESDGALRDLRIAEFRITMESLRLVRGLREAIRASGAEGEPATAAKAALRANFGEAFDTRRKIHAREIEVLEARVNMLREELGDRAGARDQFVDARMAEVQRMIDRGGRERREDKPGGPPGPPPGPR